MDRHGGGVLIPLRANFLLKLIYPLLRNNTKLTTLSTLYNYGKTRVNLRHRFDSLCFTCFTWKFIVHSFISLV